MSYYKDPTAWAAIANVQRERDREELAAKRQSTKTPKKEYEPRPPVDAFKVFHAKNKKVSINKAWVFYSQVKKSIEGGNNGHGYEKGGGTGSV